MERDKFDTLADCVRKLTFEFSRVRDIGEPLFITDIYTALKDVDGVADVQRVKIIQKTGGLYSDVRFNIEENRSADGRYINIPENAIFEIKFPLVDIKGKVR